MYPDHEKRKRKATAAVDNRNSPPPDVSPASARLPATLTGTAPTKKEEDPAADPTVFLSGSPRATLLLFFFFFSSSACVFLFFAISWKVSVGYIYRVPRLDLIYTDNS